MKVLITGGTGYVGGFLTKELIEQGYEVGIIVQEERAEVNSFIYTGKIEELKTAFESFKPDKVIHLAADVSKQISSDSLDKMLSANILLPAYLLQLSTEYNVQRFVNISTFSTSIDGKSYNPQTYYAATKKATEDLATYYSLHTNLSVVTLCFYDIYGPNQPHARFLNAVINAIDTGVELHMSPGDQEICFLNVNDAVDAIIYAQEMPLTKNEVHTYCVYGAEVFTLKEVPQLLAKLLNMECPAIIHDIPYRDIEIMKFAPPYPLLKGWQAKTHFAETVKNLG